MTDRIEKHVPPRAAVAADLARVSIASGELTCEIDALGAQLFRLQDPAGRDLLWNGDPAVWSGRAPILFPIVGALAGGQYRLGAKRFSLSRHGFARGKLFSIEDTTHSTALFRLRDDAASLAVYPFHFELDVHFEVSAATLSMTIRVRNTGDRDMPASVGYHPALRWPLPYDTPRDAHFIEFEVEEPAPVRRIDANGLLTPQPHATPVAGRRLLLTDALFRDDVLIFDRLLSRALVYGSAAGPRLRVNFPDAPYLGLWTKPGANFICIEPWHGVTDPVGYAGDFKDKPGVFVLAPGGELATTLVITLIGAS